MRRTGHARARVLFRCLALLLAAGCGRKDTLPPARQIPLAAPVGEGATLAVDSAGLLWIGTPGRLTAVDTTGRPVGTVTLARDSVPRVLWRAGPRLVLRDGRRISGADAAGGAAVAGYGSTGLRAAARDPRNRWVFTANRRGGVMGLDPASLQPRWSWPETGGEALGMAVSPLADRVYVSVDAAGDLSAAVQVRDAGSGRVLTSVEMDEPLRSLTAGPDGTLYGLADGAVVRLRPGPGGLRRVWTEAPSIGASGGQVELRMDPSGARVAVFGRGRGARLAVLDARTGRVLGVTKTAPLDAAFGAEGRLYLLEPRMIREVR